MRSGTSNLQVNQLPTFYVGSTLGTRYSYLMQTDFYSLREDLMEKTERFGLETLAQVPYHQLYLCSIATADQVSCSLKLVREEKQRRREEHLPFLFQNRLINPEFVTDTLVDLRNHNAPRWSDLSHTQRLWLKLNCIHNHTENFVNRIGEAIALLGKCRTEGLDDDTVIRIMKRLKSMQFMYPIKYSELEVRDRLQTLVGEVAANLSTKEFSQVQPEIIRDFSCMSDCYRVLV
jgi:hypothetical protein